MKTKFIALIVMSLAITPVFAEKPEWAGKGKPTEEQKEMHRAAMEAKGDDMDEHGLEEKKERKEKKEKSSDVNKGMEKQREMKSEQIQKELGKGSDKGQESRENSKKWWRFWEEE